ncbi:hypothetical protein G5B10_07690 [Fluviicola sp. SGL-29]|nr:hypothetical protein [Fluviicola sp. SGL-29]
MIESMEDRPERIYRKEHLESINKVHLQYISYKPKDVNDLKSKITTLIDGTKDYYIGATWDYEQRHCPSINFPESPISKNSHIIGGYKTMYLLGKTHLKPVAEYMEEQLIEAFPKAKNKGIDSVGLKVEAIESLIEGKSIYYIYLVIK